LLEFKSKQTVVDIAGVKVGGSLGENPTVLVGTIFYRGHKIVTNERAGEFDRKKAEELINSQDDFSERTGNPCMLDVVGSTSEAMKKFIEFVANATDAPFLVDGPTPDVRIAGLEYAKEIGVIDRAVYNSLIPEYKPEELAKMKEVGLRSSILLAYNVKEFTTNGRIKALRELIKIASQGGIDKPLLDTCVLDVPSLGSACRALFTVKDEIGLPAGCGAHNAVSLWRGLKKKFDERAVKPSLASACVVAVSVGADFVLYGPVEDAPYVFPPIAMVNAAYGHAFQMEKGTRPSPTHPIFKVA